MALYIVIGFPLGGVCLDKYGPPAAVKHRALTRTGVSAGPQITSWCWTNARTGKVWKTRRSCSTFLLQLSPGPSSLE